MIIQPKCEKLYAFNRSIGITIDVHRNRMLSMHHWECSPTIRLWWIKLRLTFLWSTYV